MDRSACTSAARAVPPAPRAEEIGTTVLMLIPPERTARAVIPRNHRDRAPGAPACRWPVSSGRSAADRLAPWPSCRRVRDVDVRDQPVEIVEGARAVLAGRGRRRLCGSRLRFL